MEKIQHGVKQVHSSSMKSKYGITLKSIQQPEMVGLINNILYYDKNMARADPLTSYDKDGHREKKYKY